MIAARFVFCLSVLLAVFTPLGNARAQATPQLLPRYSLLASAPNGFDGMTMNAPAPKTTTPPPQGNLKRGAYVMAIGLGLVTGAALNAAIFGSVRVCGNGPKVPLIADGVMAATGLAFTLGGWGDFTLAPRTAALDTRTRRFGLPATFVGAALFSFGAMAVIPLAQCVSSD